MLAIVQQPFHNFSWSGWQRTGTRCKRNDLATALWGLLCRLSKMINNTFKRTKNSSRSRENQRKVKFKQGPMKTNTCFLPTLHIWTFHTVFTDLLIYHWNVNFYQINHTNLFSHKFNVINNFVQKKISAARNGTDIVASTF